MPKSNRLLLLTILPLLLLSACRETMHDAKTLKITPKGIFLEGIDHPLARQELADSLQPFCIERKRWLVEADTAATARDLMPLFDAALVKQPCKGLLHFKTAFSESWVMPLIPISRNYYSLREDDTTKPVLCMTVYAHQFGIGLTLISGMLDPINTVHTPDGKEFVQDNAKPQHVAQAWIDDYERCLVPLRKARCVDTLDAHTRYVRVGQFERLMDTLWSDSLPKDIQKKPLTLDIALRAQFHVLKTLKGSLSRGNYYHLMADSTMDLNQLFDRISSFRRINIDFNTYELR